MSNRSLEQILWDRLNGIRTELLDLRSQLDRYKSLFHNAKGYESLYMVEAELDRAQSLLSTSPPDLEQARSRICAAREQMDVICHAITIHRSVVERRLATWTVLVLALTGLTAFWVWRAIPTDPEQTVLGLPEAQWLILRAALLTGCGGMAGSAINLSRLLYLAIPARTLDLRNVLWYTFEPIFGAALAISAYVLVRAGIWGSGGASGAPLGFASSAAAFALGFLVGFVPSAVHQRLNSIIKAVFGTEEVRGPQITSPQVRVQNGLVSITATVNSSPSTRVTAANAILQTPQGNSTAALRRGAGYQWTGEISIPSSITDLSLASLYVEARDESGNVSRSEPVSLSLANVPDGGAITPSGSGEAPAVTVYPSAGQKVGPVEPFKVNINRTVLDIDPALTTEMGESIELVKRWNEAMTEVILEHGPLAPGSYCLVLEGILLPDGETLPDDVEIRFEVTESPANNN